MKRKLNFVLLLLILIGCVGVKPFSEMTQKEKALFFIQTYNQQYDDTMYLATFAESSDAQKELVIKKKAILMKVWPLIKLYDSIVSGGGIPTAGSEQEIINLINELVAMR